MSETSPADEKDLLVLFYVENARQARHYEEQRQSITNAVLITAAVVLAGAAIAPRLGLSTALGGLVLMGAGTFGFLASLRSHERSRLHVERLHAVRDRIGDRLPVDVASLYEAARLKHARRYPTLSERTARVHYLWQALHACVAAAGLLLALASAWAA
jgi:hypothetical protein